jgi:hypothetical protein
MRKLVIINLAIACIIPSVYGLIGDTEAQFVRRGGKVTDRDTQSKGSLVVTKVDGSLVVTDYFDKGLSVGEVYRKPDNSPFTIEEIKALAKAYGPIEKWDFFGKWGHMADLMLVNDKSGRRWIRLQYGPGNPGHPYVVQVSVAEGSPYKH